MDICPRQKSQKNKQHFAFFFYIHSELACPSSKFLCIAINIFNCLIDLDTLISCEDKKMVVFLCVHTEKQKKQKKQKKRMKKRDYPTNTVSYAHNRQSTHITRVLNPVPIIVSDNIHIYHFFSKLSIISFKYQLLFPSSSPPTLFQTALPLLIVDFQPLTPPLLLHFTPPQKPSYLYPLPKIDFPNTSCSDPPRNN